MALGVSPGEGAVPQGHRSGRRSQGEVSGVCGGKAKASCFCIWPQAARVSEAAPFPKHPGLAVQGECCGPGFK